MQVEDDYNSTVLQLRFHVKQSLETNLTDNAVFFATQLEALTIPLTMVDLNDDKQRLAEAYFANKQYQRAYHLLENENLMLERLDSQYLAARCKASLFEWESCLKILENIIQPVASKDNNSDSQQHLKSAMFLLRALENRQKAMYWYQQALLVDIYCYEAFDALSKGHMMTSTEGKELLNSLPFTADSSWLKRLYTCKLMKYTDTLKSSDLEVTDIFSNRINNIEMDCVRAETLFYQNQFQRAYKLAHSILEHDPYVKGSILTVYISCLVELKLKSELFNFSHKLVSLYPNEAISWYSVGCYYYVIKGYGDARHYFSKSTSADKDYGAPWLAFGHAFAVQGEHDQALAAYRSAHRLLIGSHLPPLCIGMELVRANDLSLAAQFINQAKDICPYDPLIFNELGVIEYKNGNIKEAINYFEAALGLLKKERDEEKAEEGSNSDLGGRDEYIWVPWEPTIFNLGHCYRKLGKYKEAFEQYKRSNQLRPESGSTYTALGFTKHIMGETEVAIEYYHKALGLDPDDAIAETMLKKALQEYSSLPCTFILGEKERIDAKICYNSQEECFTET